MTLAVGLILYALRQNVDLYYTPSQLLKAESRVMTREVRLGGLVQKGSVKRHQNSLDVRFELTDGQHQILVTYQGLLPVLFREGQGIVAEGKLNAKHVFVADQVLAKHDANYRPPEINP